MRELLSEIFESLRQNKLRTSLTGFSVAWGIFMLVVLLGAGNGLKNGLMSNFGSQMINSGSIFGGYTTVGYGGFNRYREVFMRNEDLDVIMSEFGDYVKDISALDWYNSATARYENMTITSGMRGVTPEIGPMLGEEILYGRYINSIDMKLRRKTAVVDENIVKVLFKGENPVGKTLMAGDIPFKIVGVLKTEQYSTWPNILIPLSTGQLIYSKGDEKLSRATFVFQDSVTEKDVPVFEQALRTRMSKKYGFSPDDMSVFYIWNNMESYKSVMTVFRALSIFIWMIGIGTLMAGIVGVANIMLVTVRERTFEIGIRKALGASPRSVVGMIIAEAVVITALFGYIGMCAGVGVMEGVNSYLVASAGNADPGDIFSSISFFKDPTLDISIVVSATAVLMAAGVIAGYIPARRAARVKTIDALRDSL